MLRSRSLTELTRQITTPTKNGKQVFALNNLLCATLLYLTAHHHTSGQRCALVSQDVFIN
jgi:hypothetical protein